MGHLHDGHRSRLRERLEREGLDHFQPHEVLELLLFYCIPVRNVNQLAHELVNRFGSVGGVLAATKEELMTQPGVGASTADWLTSLRPLLNEYLSCRMTDRPQLNKFSRAAEYATRVMPEEPAQQLWSIAMTQSGHLLGSALIATGDAIRLPSLHELVDFLLRYRAQAVVLAQRRLPGDMDADERDRELVAQLESVLVPLRIYLMDNMLFCGHRHLSMRKLDIIHPKHSFTILNEDPGATLDGEWFDETDS